MSSSASATLAPEIGSVGGKNGAYEPIGPDSS